MVGGTQRLLSSNIDDFFLKADLKMAYRGFVDILNNLYFPSIPHGKNRKDSFLNNQFSQI